jgi:hypothetical protein
VEEAVETRTGKSSGRNFAVYTFGAILLAVASTAKALVMYGSDQLGNLYSVNLATGAGTLIGNSGAPTATEIEFDNQSGTLYSEETDGGPGLHTHNPATGASTGSVIHPFGALNGLEAVSGTLYGTFITGSGAPSSLVTVNTVTGALTNVGAGTGFGPVSGLAYDAANATMFGVTAGGAPANLITINLLTGVGAIVAPILDSASGAAMDHIGSIEFGPGGILYAGTAANANVAPNSLFTLNTATGAASLVGPTGFSVTGLTLEASVPEPATLALLGLGIVGIGYQRRKRLTV